MLKTTKKLQYILFMSVAIKVLGLIYKIITTRMLGLEGMRLTSMIMPLLALCLSLSSFSIQSVCNQNISLNITTKENKASTIMLACLRVTLTSSSIVSILMLLSFPLYEMIYDEAFIYYPLLLCVPLIYLSNVSGVMKGYLEANNRFSITYLSNVIESIAKLTISVFLLYILKDYSIKIQVFACFLGLMLSEVSSCFYLLSKIKKGRKIDLNQSTNKYEIKVFKQALPLTLEALMTTLSGYITPFIFYYAAGKNNITFYESTSYYALITAYAIPLLINGQFTTLTLTKLLFPNVTKNRDNSKVLSSIIDQALFITTIFSFISFSLCYHKGLFMLDFLYDNTLSYNIVRKLAPIYILLYFDPIFIMILQSFNKEKTLFFISLISHIITMSLILIFTLNPNILLDGYVYGLSIGGLIKCLLLIIFSYKYSTYNPSLIKLGFILGLSILYIALASIVSNPFIYLGLMILYLLSGLLLFYFFYKKNLFFHPNNLHK